MSALARWFRRVVILVRRDRFRSELDEEMDFHREQVEKDLLAEGMSRDQAHHAATRNFGNPTQLREESHRMVAFRWETVMQDVRFALRQLRKNPGFAATAILDPCAGYCIQRGHLRFCGCSADQAAAL